MAASPVDAKEVEAEDVVRQGDKPPMRTDGAADMAHVADNGLPAVQTDGAVPGPAGRCALIPACVDIGPPAEKRPEEADLGLRGRKIIDHGCMFSFEKQAGRTSDPNFLHPI